MHPAIRLADYALSLHNAGRHADAIRNRDAALDEARLSGDDEIKSVVLIICAFI